MTKRRELVRTIAKAAAARGVQWSVLREGANHTIYTLDGLRIPVPRHAEIPERTTLDIYRECTPKLGEDWWRK